MRTVDFTVTRAIACCMVSNDASQLTLTLGLVSFSQPYQRFQSFEHESLTFRSIVSSTNDTASPAESLCLFSKSWMLLCKQTISYFIVQIHHHYKKVHETLKDSTKCYNSIIQLTIIWWRLLCVKSCANNSLNPNVLLCSSQMSWSPCDRIGVDLAVNCSVKSVVSESWGKMSFIFHRRTVTWIWTVKHTNSTGWKSNKNPPICVSKLRNSMLISSDWRTMLQFSSTPSLYSGKCKAPSCMVSSG